MAQHDLKLDELPKVVFTFVTDEGEMNALVINRNLSDIPYWFKADTALLMPSTPKTVRTLLFNQHIAAHAKDEPAHSAYAKRVELRYTENGMHFFEVELTQAGALFVTDKLCSMQAQSKKVVYDTMANVAPDVFGCFSPELQSALLTIGLRPA